MTCYICGSKRFCDKIVTNWGVDAVCQNCAHSNREKIAEDCKEVVEKNDAERSELAAKIDRIALAFLRRGFQISLPGGGGVEPTELFFEHSKFPGISSSIDLAEENEDEILKQIASGHFHSELSGMRE